MGNPIVIQTLSGASPTWDALYKFAKITASANVSITLSGAGTPDAGVLHFKQDATGSRTLSINGTSITVRTAANSVTRVDWSYDGEVYCFGANVTDGATGSSSTQLSTPGSFAAAAVSDTQINLTWSDVANESSYLVEVSDNGTTGWSTLATPAAGSTSYNHTGLSAGQTKYYRIKAVGDGLTYTDSAYATANDATATLTNLEDTTFTAANGWSFTQSGSGNVAVIDTTDGGVSKAHFKLAGPGASYANKTIAYTPGDKLRVTLDINVVTGTTNWVQMTGATTPWIQALVDGSNVLNIDTTGFPTDLSFYLNASETTNNEFYCRSILIQKLVF